jgi:lactate racemase
MAMHNPVLIPIRQAAWDGDEEVRLPVPDTWQLTQCRCAPLPALDAAGMANALEHPVGIASLRDLARGRRSPGIVIDDLTRPTRADEILPEVLKVLASAGISACDVTLFVATGSHAAPSEADLVGKAGPALHSLGRVVVHDHRGACVDLGRTQRGTPILVNAELMSCDLKIGIGSVFPHPAAAFSGGAKTIVPGMCGSATIRYLHDHIRPASERGGDTNCDLRAELNEIARRSGLDAVLLALPGAGRKTVSLVAGDPEAAFLEAVSRYRSHASTPMPPPDDVDAVIIDAYPFDTTLQFAHDRALWPLRHFPGHIPVVLIARCLRGAGSHEYFPAADPFRERVQRRLLQLKASDLLRLPEIAGNAWRLFAERRRPVIVLAEGVRQEDLGRVFPRGTLHRDWNALTTVLDTLMHQTPKRVVFLHTAPLLLPSQGGTQPNLR